jgi:prepilin-type N-terminal cleavage/methylation domain-containing protein/prepilin-type processing-associated H-X9-DG protein
VAPGPKAFTLVELLVVVAVIGILAGLLLPVLARAKAKGRHVACVNNLRQLIATAAIYGADANDDLPPNGFGGPDAIGAQRLWVLGEEHFVFTRPPGPNPAFTNVDYLLNPEHAAFATYLPDAQVYRCPEDRSTVPLGRRACPKVRSYALNGYLGWADWAPISFNSPQHWTFLKWSAIQPVSPANLFAFLDVAPGNVCLPGFITRMGTAGQFYHLPARQHNGQGPLSFADGHVESHRWLEARTVQEADKPWNPDHWTLWVPGNRDLQWLQSHASVLRPDAE